MGCVVFLDRDGVINADSTEFIKGVAEWKPLPGSLDAIARLCQAGFEVVVLTNQSGIARGLLSPATLDAIHAEMRRQVEAAGGRLAGIFHCPHGAEDGCRCRKPGPGLVEAATRDLGVEAQGAPFVGDRESDLLAARAGGCLPVFIQPEARRPEPQGLEDWADVKIYPDLARFVDDWLSA